MSYDIFGYKLKDDISLEETLRALNGEADEDFEGEKFSSQDKETTDEILIQLGFTKHQYEEYTEYDLEALQIIIFENEISITLPYWEESKANLNLAIKIANKIQKKTEIVFFDPQLGKLIAEENQDALNIFNSTTKAMENVLNKTKEKPWWKFW